MHARGGGLKPAKVGSFTIPRAVCRRCGCWRGAYGLEPTVEMYVAHTIEILREIRRVLRPDGVVFWNIGDSYAAHCDPRGKPDSLRNGDGTSVPVGKTTTRDPRALSAEGIKSKDLCLIPERVALAAQADGWWVRSRIVWAKPNPMPESVTDRPTDATEHIWLFAKSEHYFWDAEAVREPWTDKRESDIDRANGERLSYDGKFSERVHGGLSGEPRGNPSAGRNLRNVWAFPTQPYSGAHFATFPEELPRKAILAGTSARGACSACGAPWERITAPSDSYARFLGKCIMVHDDRELERGCSAHPEGFQSVSAEYQTLGWRPTCSCGGFILRERACFSHRRSRGAGYSGAPPRLERAWYRRRWQERIDGYWPRTVPCLVLDPFGGSGTTGRVAVELNRRAVLLDLAYAGEQAEYARLARERTSEVQRMLF